MILLTNELSRADERDGTGSSTMGRDRARRQSGASCFGAGLRSRYRIVLR